jgi:DNA invertase Pin-like site-specific DNA recombinase
MKIGYIRVSRDKQTTALQEDAMNKEHCERVFTDKMSGKRLGRSLKQLIETVTMLGEQGIELRSLKENIDTTTSTGKLMFHIIGAMAEFERDVISERTQAGLDAARARGRPKAIQKIEPRNLARAKELYAAKNNTIAEIMQMTGFRSRNTFYKYVVNGDRVNA